VEPLSSTSQAAQRGCHFRNPAALELGHVQFLGRRRSGRLADLGAKHALPPAGLGWGSMPKPMVSDDIKRGRPVRFSIDAWDDKLYQFHAVHRSDTPLGPAASWLMDRLAMNRSRK
jgi:DNA-binding transcriptional LysR family regulator